MISKSELSEIRKRLNPAYSSIIAYGMGCDIESLPIYGDDDNYSALFQDSLENKYSSWNHFIKITNPKNTHPFLEKYSREMANASASNATCYFLKTSLANSIEQINKKRFKCLELNGNVSEAICKKTNKLVKVTSPVTQDSHTPLFPNESYDSKRKIVSDFEESFIRDWVNIAIFVGCSGVCRVTESLFNLALSMRVFIVVVNPDEDCYMHDVANLSFKCTANEFFDELDRYYSDFSKRYIGDCV